MSVNSMKRVKFDLLRAFDLYLLRRDGVDCMEALMKELVPLAHQLQRRFKGLQCEDEVVARILAKFFLTMRDENVSYENEWAFLKHLRRIAYNETIDTLRTNKTQEFDYAYHCTTLPMGQVQNQRAVYRLFVLKELVRETYLKVLDKIRFWGVYREACLGYLKALSEEREMSSGWMQKRYGLEEDKARYLQSYLQVLIRSALYEVREEERVFDFSDRWTDRVEAANCLES